MSSRKKSPESWLLAGFAALQKAGPDALRAEPLARAVGTTKGSFYWHFADVPAFHAALIAHWERETQARLGTEVAADGPAEQRLRTLARTVLDDKTETALRHWAVSHAGVAAALSRVDADRHTYIGLLLRELGLANPKFARALQAALTGLPQIASTKSERLAAFDTLVDTVLAL